MMLSQIAGEIPMARNDAKRADSFMHGECMRKVYEGGHKLWLSGIKI